MVISPKISFLSCFFYGGKRDKAVNVHLVTELTDMDCQKEEVVKLEGELATVMAALGQEKDKEKGELTEVILEIVLQWNPLLMDMPKLHEDIWDRKDTFTVLKPIR